MPPLLHEKLADRLEKLDDQSLHKIEESLDLLINIFEIDELTLHH